jgi:predicted acylesterase/phospholipase RssA
MSAPTGGAGLRPDLPFRRVALVLTGGGALGAYEVGVLRVLETLKLVPTLIVGVSIGAINAVSWLAAGYDAGPIERVWRESRAEALGVQWVSLALRVTGAFTAVVSVIELVLTAIGSRELSGASWLWGGSAKNDLLSVQLDIALWIVLALTGALAALYSRRMARGIDIRAAGTDGERLRRNLRNTLFGTAAVYLAVWIIGWPWPHRFHTLILMLLALAWAASSPGRVGAWVRGATLGLMPETGGRGLWSGRARRRILERIVAAGDPAKLVGPDTGLVISALAIDTGRIGHFVSWPDPAPEFIRRIDHELGEVIPVRNVTDVIDAAVASSALPGIFQPERACGRDCVDAGGFSNQPLHVAIAHGVDAMIVVVLVPSESPTPAPPPADLVALGGRLLELSNWRDLQTELRHLPPGWDRSGRPARVCVVEPAVSLPANVLAFDPERAGEVIALGRKDAWAALSGAGWLGEPDPPAPGAPLERAATRP